MCIARENIVTLHDDELGGPRAHAERRRQALPHAGRGHARRPAPGRAQPGDPDRSARLHRGRSRGSRDHAGAGAGAPGPPSDSEDRHDDALLSAPSCSPRATIRGGSRRRSRSDADAVILDLEDACAVRREDRDPPRGGGGPAAAAPLPRLSSGSTRSRPRSATATSSPWWRKGVDGIVLPKVETPDELRTAEWLLSQLERENGLRAGLDRSHPDHRDAARGFATSTRSPAPPRACGASPSGPETSRSTWTHLVADEPNCCPTGAPSCSRRAPPAWRRRSIPSGSRPGQGRLRRLRRSASANSASRARCASTRIRFRSRTRPSARPRRSRSGRARRRRLRGGRDVGLGRDPARRPVPRLSRSSIMRAAHA